MDTATAIAVGRKVAKVADRVIKYIKADNESFYGLDEEVRAELMGDGVAYVGTALVPSEYTTQDGSLTVAQTADAIDWGIRLVAHPFPVELRLWNGPDIIANNQYRSMLASLFHDLIWGHAGELAKAWGVTKKDVLTWGNGVLYALWMYASVDSLRGRIEARLAWHACEFSKPWYHTVKKWLGLHSILFALVLAAGCGTPPDWQVVEISGTNAVLRAMGRIKDEQEICLSGAETNENDVADAEIAGKPATLPTVEESSTVADGVDFGALEWCWGGFSGGKAKVVDGVEIASLKVSGSGLSYKWKSGGCEKLGASSREDYSHTLACLFVRIDGRWRGGKFDWISTSRLTRSFENIRVGYNGWDSGAVGKADAFAFVIVSKDGKKRSNVAVQGVK